MKRISLTDGSGRWFDEETAKRFKESTWWDGRNHISTPTGSQWSHEALYRTAGGAWILNSWSNYSNVAETYETIGTKQAAAWLVANGHDAPAELQPDVDSLEVKGGTDD